MTRPVTLGRVGAPHGVRGWVRVRSAARPPESILEFDTWLLAGSDGWRAYRLLEGHARPNGIVARLEGVDDREAAAALRHAAIAVPRAALPEPAAGEWYWADLVGLAVETVAGTPLGHVDGLLETGANDVLVVRGERERLIPWLPGRVVLRVEPEAGRLVVDWDPDF